jgi:ATP-dependent Zn protease
MLSFLKSFDEIFEDERMDEILEYNVFQCNQLKNNNIFKNEDDVLDEEKIKVKKKKNSIEEFENFIEIAKVLKRKLPKYIYGQDHAIEKIVDYFKNNLIKISGPKATFFFMGPPATGKTYLADIMAKSIKDYKLKVFDMAQYTRDDDGMGLYGSDFKYAKSKPGLLTDFVLKNPKSIIVFDEIEKANNSIQNALLSIFNDGKMTDKNGWVIEDGKYIPFDSERKNDDFVEYPAFPEVQEVDFSETILIFTSNVGKDLYNSNHFWDIVKNDYNMAEHMIIDALSKEKKVDEHNKELPAITSPFLSRLSSGEIILFKKLKFEHLIKIVTQVFRKYLKIVKANYNIEMIGLNKKIYSLFLLSFAPRIDIRRLKSKIAPQFFDLISDYIVENDLDIKTNRKVIIEISGSVDEFYKKEIKPLMKEDIVKYMFRKNLTLKLEKELEFKNNTFIYKIKNIYFEQVKDIRDIGEDGIIFEMPDISFDDIAGQEKVKKRLKEIVKFLKNPKGLSKFNVEIPKGMLFYGPPGTGKTMLAKALANESGLPFLATTGTDLLNEKKMDKIFETAREYSPSIIFIDEFDAIGRRDINFDKDTFINKLLSHINGFHDNEEVFIIAATNFPNRIDPAILRSGRIDLKFEIKALDKEARKYFIENILNSFKIKGDFNINKLVTYTTGMNGADLNKVKREIGFEMIRKGVDVLTQDLLIEIINTVKYGEKIENIDIIKTLKSTAIHEAGHAVIAKILRPELKIEQITITPRKDALGFVAYNNEDNYKNLSKKDIKKQLQILLAGRFSQIKKYGEEGIDSGASDDLVKATNLAYIAITKLGMDEKLGNVNLNTLLESKIIKFDEKIGNRVVEWIKEAEIEIKKLIDNNWDKIEKVANKLIEEETLDEKEFLNLLK